MTRPLCGLPAGRVPQGAGGRKWRPGLCDHFLEVIGGTVPGKMWAWESQGVAEGGGAAGWASYLPTPQSGRAAVDVSVQRLQSS